MKPSSAYASFGCHGQPVFGLAVHRVKHGHASDRIAWPWHPGRPHALGGFTFIEVLATLTLLSSVLPSIILGISMSLATAELSKRQAQAATLAHDKLMELATDSQWQHSALSGDFGTDFPDYTWSATVNDFDGVLRELQLTVVYQVRRQQRSVVLTTLLPGSETSSALAAAQR